MNLYKETITELSVSPGSLGIIWLGQAGFVFKTSDNHLIYIDIYLSDSCASTPGGSVQFKRIFPSLLEAQDITEGLIVATHNHEDHFDTESIQIISSISPKVQFAGPISCTRALKELEVNSDKIHLLEIGKISQFEGFSLHAVYADHGEHEPDAIGVVLEADGVKVYHTGDTCYCPEQMSEVIALKPDIIIPCINGAFGNLNGIEANRLADDVGAKVAIPSHFWLFVGQNLTVQGLPATFLKACEQHAPNTKPKILSIGEPYIYTG